MSLHLAVDLGAGSGRAFLGRVEAGCLAFDEVHRFHYQPRPVAGHLRWNATGLFDGIRVALGRAAAAAVAGGGRVVSAGVDSWGVDYGLLDAAGSLVEEPIAYRDERTAGVMDEVFRVMPRREVFARTGLQFMALNTLYQLVAHVRDGLPAGAARLLLIPDLCHHFLSGVEACELTDASTTQLLNAVTGQWDETLFERLGLPWNLMPALVPTGTHLGPLRPALAREAGLDGLTVVAPATHDTACAVAATPLEPDVAFISSGTWSLVGVERADALLGDEVARANFTNERGAFGTIRFLKNVAGLWLLESCRREWDAEGRGADLPSLLAATADLPGFVGFVHPDAGRFFNPASMTREIGAALKETGQAVPDGQPQLAKVVLDSLALRYASVIETAERLTGTRIARVHVVGGGSLNRYLNQATANATGRPVEAGPVEATVAGNVLVQAVAAGTLASLAEGRALLRRTVKTEVFEPRDTKEWEKARERYAEIEAQG
jgi:rhamnulokinase